MSERVLTPRDLNRALLARQLLLERSKLPVPRALERICGIQNQYAPNGYIRLWSCLERFERDDLTRALERRTVIQGTLMRETIHLVSRADYPLFAAAIRRSGQEWWRRVNKVPADADFAPLVRATRRFLRGRTATWAELLAFLREHGPNARGIGHWVDLVRVPPSGTWDRRRAHTFALADEWVGPLDVSEHTGIEHLARRYLRGFGPAYLNDLSSFTGIPIMRLKPVLDRIELRRFRDEAGKELIDVRGAPLPDPEIPAPVRFLPTWDSALLVHARRAAILSEEHRAFVFDTRMPPSYPTFLVDGRVAGTWRFSADRIELQPFGRIPRSAQRELKEESERLVELHH